MQDTYKPISFSVDIVYRSVVLRLTYLTKVIGNMLQGES